MLEMNMHKIIQDKINDLVATVQTLENSRAKSMALTKLDEARHWIEDDRLAVHYANGGI
jgi:hypothetical protein